VRDPNATTEGQIERLREAGLGDREIFEATAFVAFRLAFSTINDALGAAPDQQLAEAAPRAVRAAVSYGRPPLRGPSGSPA
jgi:alkylhydroperoxidase/carboxymuconolactone decarboxylase family protein YurZ